VGLPIRSLEILYNSQYFPFLSSRQTHFLQTIVFNSTPVSELLTPQHMRSHVLIFFALSATAFAQASNDDGCGNPGDLCLYDAVVPGTCCNESNGYTLCIVNSTSAPYGTKQYTGCGTGNTCVLTDPGSMDNTPTCVPGDGDK
jgi:hypothetical protein